MAGLLLGAGCARVKPSAPAVRAVVYVDTESISRRHPLWASTDKRSRAIVEMPVQGARVPTLPRPLEWAPVEVGATTRERRAEARGKLEAEQRRGMQGLSAARDDRTEEAAFARKRELEAEEGRLLAASEAQWFEDAEREGSEAAKAAATDLALLRASLDTVDAQLQEGFLIAVSPSVLASEQARLSGSRALVEGDGPRRSVRLLWNGDLIGVSTRGRLTAARTAIVSRIGEITASLELARRDAMGRFVQRRDAARAEAAVRIARQVEQLKEQRRVDLAPLLERQNYAMLLERTLLVEETPSATLASGKVEAWEPGGGWQLPPALKVAPIGDAARKAVAERMRARVRAMVEAQARDWARESGFDLVFVAKPGVPDRTAEFARRMGLQGE